MAEAIHIPDLADPVLTPAQRAAINASPAVTMDAGQALAAARAATGLEDFGAPGFRARLDLWLASFDEDRGLNALGRAGLFADCVRQASTRLRFEDAWKRHPEIAATAIDRLRSLPLWESMDPVSAIEPPPPPEHDPRRLACLQMWTQFEELLPLMPAMHEMDPAGIHEDVELLGPDFSGYLIEWTSRPYRWRNHYLAHDKTPHYAYAKRLLQYLTWVRGPNRWVLKSPPHMENLAAVDAVYPDATIVITHRDPLAVLQSAITMIAYGDRIRRTVDLAELATYWIDRIEVPPRRCVAQRDALPHALDVRFQDYMADQIGTIERVYALAELELTTAARAGIECYLSASPRGKHGQVAYDLRGDFGIDPDMLAERFGFYCERFGIEREVR